MSNRISNRNKRTIILMMFVAFCMLLTGLFCVVDSMMPADAASSVIPLKCTPSPKKGCTPTPSPTKKPTPTPSPTPSPTPKPTSTPPPTSTPVQKPTPTPTQPSGVNNPTPTPMSTPVPGGGPVPPTTATAQANQTPTSTTTNSSVGSPPPSNGGNSGGSSTGTVFAYAALTLALVAFLLYLIPQGQSSLLVRLLSLVLPTSVARRFGTK